MMRNREQFSSRSDIDELYALASKKSSGAANHLIDNVDTSTVEANGRGTVVTITGNNAVDIALYPDGEFAYGVYEGTPGVITTTGITQDILIEPGSPTPVANDSIFVSENTAGTVTVRSVNNSQVAVGTVVDASAYDPSTNPRVKAYFLPPQNPIGSSPSPPPPP